MKTTPARPGTRNRAFQIKDLLCLLAVISLLGAVQLSSLAGTREGSLADQCRNNLRRLAQAWLMYAEDNAGRITPNNGSIGTQVPASHPGTWVNGWLDFSAHTDNINTDHLVNNEQNGKHGLLGPYVQKDASVFRCPADASSVLIAGRWFNRVRSVSMNSWMGGDAYCGMTQYRQYRALAEISTPGRRWVVSEEIPTTINDGWYGVRMEPGNGGWLVEYPGTYHSGGAWFTFADGHLEHRRWVDPRTMPAEGGVSFIPLQIPMNPPNPDMAWLQEGTTELQ